MALDLEALQHLTDAQKESYMQAEKFFASEFWPWLKQWAAINEAQQTERMLNANNWDFYSLAKGARFAYSTMANLEKITEFEFEKFAEAAAEAKSEAELNVDQGNE